ncbi:hypothetical protein HLASA_1134 [Halanaeroarchaeum sulfurireducens]|uniref:Uncharacterized protein n=1 Tax=Halanaeroarchaeum sulfurireducens TaxID=1604004 RepID=A0A0N9N2T0_9EURY|nr:hypothetical protein HLASA_1134 [Halanaeroarchaeum sulfurireducens]
MVTVSPLMLTFPESVIPISSNTVSSADCRISTFPDPVTTDSLNVASRFVPVFTPVASSVGTVLTRTGTAPSAVSVIVWLAIRLPSASAVVPCAYATSGVAPVSNVPSSVTLNTSVASPSSSVTNDSPS